LQTAHISAEMHRMAANIAQNQGGTSPLALEPPAAESMFAHVYSEAHPVMDAQRQQLADYEASFEGGA